MFIDAQTQLDAAHAYSANAVSQNGYDVGAVGNDISVGEVLGVIVAVTVAAKVSSTTETYQFDVIQADDNALTVNVVVLASYPFTNAQAAAILTAGSIINLPIPIGSVTKRFVGTRFVGANTPTITTTQWIAAQTFMQKDKYYATRIAVL